MTDFSSVHFTSIWKRGRKSQWF